MLLLESPAVRSQHHNSADLLQLLDLICALAVLPLQPVHVITVHSTPVNSCQQFIPLRLKLVCSSRRTNSAKVSRGFCWTV
jgi:hypothetical protein